MGKSSWTTSMALAIVLGLAPGSEMALAQSATAAAMTQREIDIGGQALSRPYSFAYGGTTFMPIWYVMQALKSLDIAVTWNGSTHQWNIAATTSTNPRAVAANSQTGVYVNGIRVENAPTIVRKDPVSGVDTTFMPIWYVMQALRYVGVTSSWTNGVWNMVDTPSSAASGNTSTSSSSSATGNTSGGASTGASDVSSGNTPATSPSSANAAAPSSLTTPSIATNGPSTVIDGQTVPTVTLANGATNDAGFWQRASESFYVSAQTNDPASTATGTPLLAAQPNQTLYLFAFTNASNVVNSNTSWVVNSANATITPGTSEWTQGNNNQQIAKADFIARTPGIYTVQAEYGGVYSVPLVITVGQSQLPSAPFTVPSGYTGVLPLPTGLPSGPQSTHSGLTYLRDAAAGGWIPISGTTAKPLSSITVVLTDLKSKTQPYWDYRLPIENGVFSGLVRSPFTGTVQVTLFPNYLKTLTAASRTAAEYTFPNSFYTVDVSGATPAALRTALLSSTQGDYNMSPKFNATAAALLENSPSINTAVEAISNYVSDSIVYSTAEAQIAPNGTAPNYLFEDNLSAWNSGSGVCQDYATLTASLLQSVGIPTQVLGGYANSTWTTPNSSDKNPQDAHAWLQAWNGSNWILLDPTWNDDSQTIDSVISDEFVTNTVSFNNTHVLDPSQTGVVASRYKSIR